MLSNPRKARRVRAAIETKEELSNRYNKFKDKFAPFKNIKVGDKIGRYNGTYYIQEKGNGQHIKRWWHKENRKNTFVYLDEDFLEFFKLCDDLKCDMNRSCDNVPVKAKILTLIDGMIPGLYNLRNTYIDSKKGSEGEKLCYKIDSIILTMIDFKHEVDREGMPSSPMVIVFSDRMNSTKITSLSL